MHLHSGLAQPLFSFRIDRRGAEFHRRARLIFVFVIVKAALGNDFDRRQRPVAQHAHIDLAAAHVLLDHHAAILKVSIKRGSEFLARFGNRHADGRAAVDGFDHARKNRAVRERVDIALRVIHDPPFRRLYARSGDQPLGQILVHRQRAAQIAAARVFNAQQIQRRLNAPVLAARAVQPQKHRVRQLAELQHALSHAARALPFARGDHPFQIRLLLGNARLPKRRKVVEQLVQIALIVLQAHKHIHQYRLMAELAQRAANQRAAGNGNVALHAQPAAHDHNLHFVQTALPARLSAPERQYSPGIYADFITYYVIIQLYSRAGGE